jgi:hypothetical protein
MIRNFLALAATVARDLVSDPNMPLVKEAYSQPTPAVPGARSPQENSVGGTIQ